MKYLFVLGFVLSAEFIHSQSILPLNYLKSDYSTRKVSYFSANSSPDKIFYFFPTIGKYKSLFINDDTKFLETNSITYSDSLNNIALYSEIASDYLGPVRVSTGITLSYPKNGADSATETKVDRDKFVQRLGSGSGALNFNFALPIFYYQQDPLTATLTLSPRFSLEPPSFGVSSGAFPINTSFALDLQVHLVTIKKVFDFMGSVHAGYVAGNSAFYNMLSLNGDDRKAFWLNSYTAGVVVTDKFSFSYTGFWGTKPIKDRIKPSIAFTVQKDF